MLSYLAFPKGKLHQDGLESEPRKTGSILLQDGLESEKHGTGPFSSMYILGEKHEASYWHRKFS